MKLYNCALRLAGSVLNEVPKANVTAAEIEVLRGLHGSDAVRSIEVAGSVNRKSMAERKRLYALYMNPASCTPEDAKKKMEMFRNLFGHDQMPLPEALEDIVRASDETPEEDDEEVEDEVIEAAPPVAPVRRTRVAKSESAALE